jgi:hypothetical protein
VGKTLNDKELLLQSVFDSLGIIGSYTVYAKIFKMTGCLNVIDGPIMARAATDR